MAAKGNRGQASKMPEGKVSIKWVKRANMWCKTWFEYSDKGGATQKQEWLATKPSN